VDPETTVTPATGRSARQRQAIVRAAREVFLRHGYAGATMDEVAAGASVSKQTLYKHFTDKQNLFGEVILETILTELFERLSTAADTLESAADVREGLRALADGYLQGLLQPEVIRLRRLVIGEADRFPDVGKAWFDQGFERTLGLLGESMQRLAERGRLRDLADPTMAAYHFAGLVMYQPMNQALFTGTKPRRSDAELRRIADAAVDVFLAAYGPLPRSRGRAR
jgi:TetR/AcrR family transcriptional regulator, mexJK operon transcriptional repressor